MAVNDTMKRDNRLQDEILLSIILPVYNSEKYVEEAIRSVVDQPGEGIELIIVDDGSTDRSPEIINLYRERSNVRIIHKENEGVCIARNTGIDLARGKYINFLDHDDIICHHAYTDKMANYLRKSSDDLIVFSHINADEKLRWGNIAHPLQIDSAQGKEYEKHCLAHHQYTLIRRELVKDVYFPPRITYREDMVYYWLVYERVKKIKVIDRPWYVWRNVLTSVSHNRNRRDQQKIHWWIGGFVYGYERAKTDELRSIMQKYILVDSYNYFIINVENGVSESHILSQIVNDRDVQKARERKPSLFSEFEEMLEKFSNEPKSIVRQIKTKGWKIRALTLVAHLPVIHRLNQRFRLKMRMNMSLYTQ